MRLVLALALLIASALPAAAQMSVGPCIGGYAWTAGASYASYGNCDAPEEDALLTLSCRGGATEIDLFAPIEAADGASTGATLFVGQGDFYVLGTARFMGLSGDTVLLGAPVGFDFVEALASSQGGSIETQAGSFPFHLSGSRDAIETMRATCR